jgi:hypothetical protein
MTPTTPLQDLPLAASTENGTTAVASRGVGLSHALVEVAARAGAATMLSLFAYAAITQWRAAPSRITLLLLVVAACVTVGLSLFTRVPMKRDWRPFAFFCSMGGTYYFIAVRLAPGAQLVPEAVGAALQLLGIFWQLFAKA